MQKLLTMTKLALVGCSLASGATGCCLFGNNDTCGKKDCCEQKSGANTSMTISAGTDGVSVGGEANLGSHGASSEMKAH